MRWQVFAYAAGFGTAAVVLAALVWAASERAKLHRQWERMRREVGERTPRLTHWCMAVGTVAGCA